MFRRSVIVPALEQVRVLAETSKASKRRNMIAKLKDTEKGSVQITVSIRPSLARLLDRHVESVSFKRSTVVAEAIRQYLTKDGGK